MSQLNSKNLIDGIPIDDHADSGDETTYNAMTTPGGKRGDDGSRSSKVEVLTRQIAFSSTGREWAAVSGEGLHVYSIDDDMVFDPIELTEEITPSSVVGRLRDGKYSIALRMAVHLNEVSLIETVIEQTPFDAIEYAVQSTAPKQIDRLMQVVSHLFAESPHIEFYLQWCFKILQLHGLHMERHRPSFMRTFRAMYKEVSSKHNELKNVSDSNRYMLDFLEHQAYLVNVQQNVKDTASTD
jgi:periodic tryptophan protein 2